MADKEMELQDRDLLVRLDTKLDALVEQVAALTAFLQQHDGRIRAVETDNALLKSQQDTLLAEISKLRASGNWKDSLIAIGSVAALIITLFGIQF